MNTHSNLKNKRSPVDFLRIAIRKLHFLLSFTSNIRIWIVNIWLSCQFPRFSDLSWSTIIFFSWFCSKRDLVFQIMRVTHDYFVETHDNKHRYHSNYHRKGQLSLMQRWWLKFSWSFLKKLIKIRDSLWYDIDHRNWKKERSTECHSQIHYSFVSEARESGDTVAKDGNLKKEDDHECHFDDNYTSHCYNNSQDMCSLPVINIKYHLKF